MYESYQKIFENVSLSENQIQHILTEAGKLQRKKAAGLWHKPEPKWKMNLTPAVVASCVIAAVVLELFGMPYIPDLFLSQSSTENSVMEDLMAEQTEKGYHEGAEDENGSIFVQEKEMIPASDEQLQAYRVEQASYKSVVESTDNATGKIAPIEGFYDKVCRVILDDVKGENIVFSPVNLYRCGALIGKISRGESRNQVLRAFEMDDIDTFERYSFLIQNAVHQKEGNNKCLLGQSLWMDASLSYDQKMASKIAGENQASVFWGEGGEMMDACMQTWVNQMTENISEGAQKGSVISQKDTSLNLLSTIEFLDSWEEAFDQRKNSMKKFGQTGDQSYEFMNKTFQTFYQETKTTQEVLIEFADHKTIAIMLPQNKMGIEEWMAEMTDEEWQMLNGIYQKKEENKKNIFLSVPKFHYTSNVNLTKVLQEIGITDVFDRNLADLTPLAHVSRKNVSPFISKICQTTMIGMDEEGEKEPEIEKKGSMYGMENIEMLCDHPFFYCIRTIEGIPLFAGVVNHVN